MRLSSHTDYALRVLILLATAPESQVPTPEIADSYGVSYHHLNKVVTALARHGYLEMKRGRAGGARLAAAPTDINVGSVVRHLESMDLVECLSPERNECVIAPACGLTPILRDAAEAFLEHLDQFTLEDIVQRRRTGLRALLKLDTDRA